MNKKLILGIIAGIVALALIIVVAVLVINKIDINNDKGDSSTPSSSDVSGQDTTGSSKEDTSSVIEEGNVGIGSAEGSASDTVKVPITFSKNPGVFAGQYYFEYDATALEYVGYEEGDLFEEYGDNAKDGVVNFVINAKDLKDVTKNGTLVTLEFKIKADAKPGDYAITLGKETLICNLDEQTVAPEIKEGKITVK